jgi:hypothetical protein
MPDFKTGTGHVPHDPEMVPPRPQFRNYERILEDASTRRVVVAPQRRTQTVNLSVTLDTVHDLRALVQCVLRNELGPRVTVEWPDA